MDGTIAAIKKIVDVFSDKDGTRYFRVVWKDTWEPELHLISCQEALDEFWKNRKRLHDVSIECKKSSDFACQTDGIEVFEHPASNGNCVSSMLSPTIQCSLVNTTSVNFDCTTEIKKNSDKTLDVKTGCSNQDFAVQCCLHNQADIVDAIVQTDVSQPQPKIICEDTYHSLDEEISFCDVECQSEQEFKDYALQHNPEVKGFGVQWYPQTRSRGVQVRKCCQSQANDYWEHNVDKPLVSTGSQYEESVSVLTETGMQCEILANSLVSTASQYEKNMILLTETGTQCESDLLCNSCSGMKTASMDDKFHHHQNSSVDEGIAPLSTVSPMIDSTSECNDKNDKNYTLLQSPAINHQSLLPCDSNDPPVEQMDENTFAPNLYSANMSEFLKKQLLGKLVTEECNYKEMLFVTENPINAMCLQDRADKSNNRNPESRCRKRPISNRRGAKRRRMNAEMTDVKVKVEKLSRTEFSTLNRMTSSQSTCATHSQPIVSTNLNGNKINAVPMRFSSNKREHQFITQNDAMKVTVPTNGNSPEFTDEHDEELSLDESVASTVYDPNSPIADSKTFVGCIKSQAMLTKSEKATLSKTPPIANFTETGKIPHSDESMTAVPVLPSLKPVQTRSKVLEEKKINEDFISRYWSPS